jgi:hypothetical protein
MIPLEQGIYEVILVFLTSKSLQISENFQNSSLDQNESLRGFHNGKGKGPITSIPILAIG